LQLSVDEKAVGRLGPFKAIDVEAFVQAEVWRLVDFAFVILAVAIPVQREIRLSPIGLPS